SNTRDPEERALDLRVQIATNERGAEAARALVRQMGLATVRQAIDDVLTYTRRRMARRVADLADGEYTFTNYLDDDGMGGEPVPARSPARKSPARSSVRSAACCRRSASWHPATTSCRRSSSRGTLRAGRAITCTWRRSAAAAARASTLMAWMRFTCT